MANEIKRALGPVMCDLRGIELEVDEREMLLHPKVGGVILFSRNYASTEQLASLCETIHGLRQSHLLIAVDHEGGRVQRFRDGFTRLPACAAFSSSGKDASKHAEQAGWIMASELLAVGIDLSFAPVLDIGGDTSEVIGDRAFHTDPNQIVKLARAYINGMKQAGMAAVGKHFPGHGSVVEDSHTAIPYDDRDYQDIEMLDLIPFNHFSCGTLVGMMPAHVIYSKVDMLPAGFSAIWLKQILRRRLGFQGTIFSDDLSMAGAEVMGGYPERAEAAISAGCDMVLVCNDQTAAQEILDKANLPKNIESQSRLIRVHGQFKTTLEDLKSHVYWRKCAESMASLQLQPELNLGVDDIV